MIYYPPFYEAKQETLPWHVLPPVQQSNAKHNGTIRRARW